MAHPPPYDRIELDPRTVAGVERRLSNADMAGLAEHWQAFLGDDVPGRIEGRTDDALVAVYSEYESDHTGPYNLLLGCEVDPAAFPFQAEELLTLQLPGGTYARFVAEGEQPAALVATWTAIHGLDLPRSYVADFERHVGGPSGRVEIYVGLGPGRPATDAS